MAFPSHLIIAKPTPETAPRSSSSRHPSTRATHPTTLPNYSSCCSPRAPQRTTRSSTCPAPLSSPVSVNQLSPTSRNSAQGRQGWQRGRHTTRARASGAGARAVLRSGRAAGGQAAEERVVVVAGAGGGRAGVVLAGFQGEEWSRGGEGGQECEEEEGGLHCCGFAGWRWRGLGGGVLCDGLSGRRGWCCLVRVWSAGERVLEGWNGLFAGGSTR